ncbi:MAG: hypothetical protein KBC27_02525 [Rickettsiales bacterium]|nr:hypothetical protein [Rickettsiales bacterium]
MSRSYDKHFLNCNISLSEGNEHNIEKYRAVLDKTAPVIIVYDKLHKECSALYGVDIIANISCNKVHEPDEALLKAAIEKYIIKHNLQEVPHNAEFASIRMQQELCDLYPEPRPEDMFAPVATFITFGVISVVVLGIAGCLGHKVYGHLHPEA